MAGGYTTTQKQEKLTEAIAFVIGYRDVISVSISAEHVLMQSGMKDVSAENVQHVI